MDNAREGHPETACMPAIVQKVENKINEDNCQMLRDVASSVGVSHVTVHMILKYNLRMNKVLPHMVPRVLVEDQKETRV